MQTMYKMHFKLADWSYELLNTKKIFINYYTTTISGSTNFYECGSTGSRSINRLYDLLNTKRFRLTNSPVMWIRIHKIWWMWYHWIQSGSRSINLPRIQPDPNPHHWLTQILFLPKKISYFDTKIHWRLNRQLSIFVAQNQQFC